MADQDLPIIKNEKQYHALRERGLSKEMAARIANAPSIRKAAGKASAYQDFTYEELYEKAKALDVKGRSKMNKEELIEAISDQMA